MKRLITTLMLPALCIAVVFAAGQQAADTGTEEKVTLEVLTNYNPNIETFASGLDPNNNEIIAWLRENSGFNIHVEILPRDGDAEKVAIILASGDVPDMTVIPGGKDQYATLASQGALYAVDDILSLAPVYNAVVPEETWKSVKVNGKIYALPAPQTYHGVNGLFTRVDLIEDLGLAVPKTTGEYYTVMKAVAATGDNLFGLTSSGPWILGFIGAFGIDPPWKDFGGKLLPSAVQPQAKEYLAYMKRLYDEKILDKEFAINKGQNLKEKLIAGQALMAPMAWWDAKVTYESLMEKNPDARIEYIEPPVGPGGDYGMAKRGPLTFIRAIPRDAEHPRETIRLMDFLATEEAQDVVGFGFEGVHYTREGKVINATPKAEDIRWRIIYQWIDTPYSFNHRVRMKGYNPWFIPTEQWTVLDNWVEFRPAIDVFDKNSAPLDDFVEENYLKFIMGERPLAEFDAFKAEYLKRGGQASIDALNAWYQEFK